MFDTNGHFSKDCTANIICETCNKNHHSLLHLDQPKAGPGVNTNLSGRHEGESDAEQDAETSAVSCKAQSDGQENCTSMIVPVWVSAGRGKSKEILTYALIDSQSDCSYISCKSTEISHPCENENFHTHFNLCC